MGSGMDFIYLSEDDGMTQAELPAAYRSCFFLFFMLYYQSL